MLYCASFYTYEGGCNMSFEPSRMSTNIPKQTASRLVPHMILTLQITPTYISKIQSESTASLNFVSFVVIFGKKTQVATMDLNDGYSDILRSLHLSRFRGYRRSIGSLASFTTPFPPVPQDSCERIVKRSS